MTTMPPEMSFDADTAAKADMGARIEATGKYLGVFNKVKYQAYPSGAEGYLLDFKSSQGQVAERMFICTKNTSGEPNERGLAQISALMCVIGVKSAPPVLSQIKEYDFDAKKDVDVQVYLFPAAMNKPVGVVLQKELFTNTNTGKDSMRMNLELTYHADTERVAAEMINKEQASRVEEYLSGLGDKDNRSSNYGSAAQPGSASAAAPAAAQSAVDFDDDIPF